MSDSPTMQAPPPEATQPGAAEQPQQPNAAPPVQLAPLPPEQRVTPRVTIEQLAQLPNDEYRQKWINSMVEAELARQNYAQDRALARDFAACGQFDDINRLGAEQAIATAMVKIQLGRSWGFGPADSMRYVYFVNGKPAIENDIVASKLQQAGWAWEPEFSYETITDKGKPWKKCTGCTLWLKRWDDATRTYKPVLDRAGAQVSESFTEADADHAEVYERGKTISLSQKAIYRSWPKDMYYWRAISRVRKYHAPNVLRGGTLREEALDVVPGEAPPEMLPPEKQEQAPAPEPRRRDLKKELMSKPGGLLGETEAMK